jgi:CRISPR/Cas system-associated exonuclease Cas4 (RecB family)
MNKIGKIEFKKLDRISPSQFYSIKKCAYKSLLAEAFERNPLLPISPNAYLGTVLHKVLELISKGVIKNEVEFKEKFDAEIFLMEEFLKQNGYGYFIPLIMNVRDFGRKKIQLKKHIRANSEPAKQQNGIKYHSEKWFESKDKLIGGKMDLVIETENEIEIIDFKTGAITENFFDDDGESYQAVKIEYQEQLKLYAYLYFDCKGKFPTRLCLIDLSKQRFNIDFTENECKIIFEEAKLILAEINSSVDSKVYNANPNENNCKFCLFRPACSFYLQYLKTENANNDIYGTIKEVIQYQNGNVSVFIETAKNKVTIVGFMSDKFEYFKKNRDKQICLFNLRKESTDLVYSVSITTKIYEY